MAHLTTTEKRIQRRATRLMQNLAVVYVNADINGDKKLSIIAHDCVTFELNNVPGYRGVHFWVGEHSWKEIKHLRTCVRAASEKRVRKYTQVI